MRILQPLLCAIALVVATPSGAQTSKEYAVMGRSVWSAFECASLASQMKDPKEQERLFNAGYKDGLAFIGALQAQKIDRRDISSEVPMGVRFLLQGPTPDFMLGRIYEAAQEEALKDVMKTGQQLNSDDHQKTLAQSKYTKQNCRLVSSTR